MLGTLEEEQKKDWRKYVDSLVYAYNCTLHETTRISPFELLFGRKPSLPIDTMFEKAKDDSTNKSTQEHIEDLQERMAKTHDVIKRHTEKAQNKQKQYYDKKAKHVNISIGDKVLVKKLAFEGKHTLADRYEPDAYIVVDQPRPDIPVFKVKSEVTDRERTLHKNHLLGIECQSSTEMLGERSDEDNDLVVSDNTERQEIIQDASKDKNTEINDVIEVIDESSSDDSDDDIQEYGYAEKAMQYGDAHEPVNTEITEVDTPVNTETNGTIKPATTDNAKAFETETAETVDIVSEETDVNQNLEEVRGELDKEVKYNTTKSTLPQNVHERGNEEIGHTLIGLRDEAETDVVNKDNIQETLDPKIVSDKGNDERVVDRTIDSGDNDVSIGNKDHNESVEKTEAVSTNQENTESDRDTEIDNAARSTKTRMPVPPPRPPRRSTRERKLPERYGEYYVHQMVNQSIDRKVTAVQNLVFSGILDTMDCDMARSLLVSAMK